MGSAFGRFAAHIRPRLFAKDGSMICKHCARTVRNVQARGLCYRCYENREIREMHPKSPVGPGQRFGVPLPREPTEAELDAMIEEQRRCLPDWWESERANAND